jgi:hypothetical protein
VLVGPDFTAADELVAVSATGDVRPPTSEAAGVEDSAPCACAADEAACGLAAHAVPATRISAAMGKDTAKDTGKDR